MKHIFSRAIFVMATIMMTTVAWAQDIIITTNAQKIDAKILEVSKSEIRYKEFDNLDGPVFILPIEDIVTIIYANGKVVLYNQASAKGKEDAAKAKSQNLIGGMFGQGSAADHTGSGAGTQGSPIGHGSSGGSSWSLSGRSLRGKLSQPSNNFNQAGKVVVQIRVDAAGNVIEAKCTTGTNISDTHTQQLALDAAKRTKFTKGDNEVIGTITYNFKFN